MKDAEPPKTHMDLSFLTDQRIENEPVKIHCPHCLKSFRFNRQAVKSKRPQFECPSCKQGFWFHNVGSLAQQTIMAFPLEWLQQKDESELDLPRSKPIAPAPIVERPLRQKPVEKPAEEIREANEHFKVSARSKRLWDKVVERYEDEPKHYEFIKACAEDGALDYAAQRYKRLSEVIPHDPLAKRMIVFIENLSLMRVTSKPPREPSALISSSWIGLVILLATVVVVIGLGFPGQKNLVGIGTMGLFFALTLKVLIRS